VSLSAAYLDYLHSFSQSCMTQDILTQAKKTFLDYLGVTVAGCSLASYSRNDIYFARNSAEQVCVIGSGDKTDMLRAAFLNGFHAHVCELDDGHRFGMLHLAAPIYSALISSEAVASLTWDSFFKGAVVGYEAAVKLARLIQPAHKFRGYHATGTCGTIGAAMSVCIAMDYTPEQMGSALAMAATSAAGLLEVIDDGSQLKPYNVGRAAMDGLQAALFGGLGLMPPDDVIGGRRGFLKSLADVQIEETAFRRFLSEERPEILNIYFKPYAACRHSHSAIEAAIRLKDQIEDVRQIDSIMVETYKLAIAGHEHTDIRGASSAKMSTCYGVACALLHGQCDLENYDADCLNHVIASGLIPRVRLQEDPVMTEMSPEVRAARLTIFLKNGQCFMCEVDHPKGEPENPMTEADIIHKMDRLFRLAGREDARALADQILRLENKPSDTIRGTMKKSAKERCHD
jgi:2-methylcitrate dehydratase PrpD